MKAMIVAGGQGSRLSSVVRDIPKPMAPVAGKPFLAYLLEKCASEGFREVILLTGYRESAIREYCGDGSRFGLDIAYSSETQPLGTGGSLRQALARFGVEDEVVLVLNGDSYFDVPLRYVAEQQRMGSHVCTVALRAVDDAGRYGSVVLRDARIVSFEEKRQGGGRGLINGGVYACTTRLLDFFPPAERCSLEIDVLPVLAKSGLLGGIPFPGRFIDIGLPEDFARANEVLPSWLKEPKHRAVFLDRDGVINVDFGYVFETKDIAFVDGAVEFLRELKSLGYLLIVVTNQAGIARGIFTEADHHAFTAALMSRLRAAGVELQDVLYCPYHPEAAVERYRVDSLDRRAGPGVGTQGGRTTFDRPLRELDDRRQGKRQDRPALSEDSPAPGQV